MRYSYLPQGIPVTKTALPASHRCRASLQVTCASRAENRGELRLFLDSASVYQWEKFSRRQIFYGITSNPILLQQDDVPQCNLKVYKILAKQALDLGFQEIHLQAWGEDANTLHGVAHDIAAIDASRVSVKLPLTAAGVEVCASIKRQKGLATLTGLHSPHQVAAAVGAGADYAAPYLHHMRDAGKKGYEEIMQMHDMTQAWQSSMRLLVASIRSPEDITFLAAQGCDTFTIPPAVADVIFEDPLTVAAWADFEAAARRLGAYNRA